MALEHMALIIRERSDKPLAIESGSNILKLLHNLFVRGIDNGFALFLGYRFSHFWASSSR